MTAETSPKRALCTRGAPSISTRRAVLRPQAAALIRAVAVD
ncbi:hypothetical protein AS96_09895 [Microbacterium sp. MRS-1]|nr:hypothetical protein AS96_09895 [Microbacterium sp. MRS-1]